MGVKNYLRSPSLNFYISSRPDQEELPFPKKALQVGEDSCMVYYDIPEKKIQWVLDRCQQSPDNRLYSEDLMFDLFAGKKVGKCKLRNSISLSPAGRKLRIPGHVIITFISSLFMLLLLG